MFLHERWLCGLVKRLGEHCSVRQVTGNLIVDILTQFVCTEIEISCIFKRTINLLVTRKRVFVYRVNLFTIHKFLTCSTQLDAIECVWFQ